MKSFSALILLAAFFSVVSTSLLNTTNIATELSSVTDQSVLTVPAAALSAIRKLGTGGAQASTLSAADKAALQTCVTDARDNNTASKAGLGQGDGSEGNIVFVAAKITLHACETAQQQVALVEGGSPSSDTAVKLLLENVGVLNVNLKDAAVKETASAKAAESTKAGSCSTTKKRAVTFEA